MHPIRLLLAIALFGASATSQSLNTDLLVVDATATLFRVSPAGRIATVGTYGTAARPRAQAIVIDTDDRFAVLSVTANAPSPAAGHLLRVHLGTGVAQTIYNGLTMYSLTLDQDGHYLSGGVAHPTAPGSHLMRIDRQTAAVTTILSSFSSPTALTKDVRTGDWICAFPLVGVPFVARLDRTFTTIRSATASLVTLQESEATSDGAQVYFAGAFDVVRFDASGAQTVTPFYGPSGNPGQTGSIAVDRAPSGLAGQIVYLPEYRTNAYWIRACDAQGVVQASFGPFASPITGLAFDRGRNLASLLTAPPNDRALAVSFAGAGNRRYVVALSTSGIAPGVALADGRSIPLNVDPLTVASLSGVLAPLWTGNVGALDATGRGAAQLALNPLGASVRGARIWATAVVLDPIAPSGIAQVGTPLVLTL